MKKELFESLLNLLNVADWININGERYAEYETGGDDWNGVKLYIEPDVSGVILSSNNKNINNKFFENNEFIAYSLDEAIEKIAEIDELSYMDVESMEDDNEGDFENDYLEEVNRKYVLCGPGLKRTHAMSVAC